MVRRKSDDRPTGSGFFHGRYLIEIVTWDWNFFLGIPRLAARNSDPPGLMEARGIYIEGRVLAPGTEAQKAVRLHISPLAAEHVVRNDGIARIGSLKSNDGGEAEWDIDGQTSIPEHSLTSVVQCLATVWRYVHIWVGQGDGSVKPITNLAFSRDLPDIVGDWASTP
jgi:hypothetical protein